MFRHTVVPLNAYRVITGLSARLRCGQACVSGGYSCEQNRQARSSAVPAFTNCQRDRQSACESRPGHLQSASRLLSSQKQSQHSGWSSWLSRLPASAST